MFRHPIRGDSEKNIFGLGGGGGFSNNFVFFKTNPWHHTDQISTQQNLIMTCAKSAISCGLDNKMWSVISLLHSGSSKKYLPSDSPSLELLLDIWHSAPHFRMRSAALVGGWSSTFGDTVFICFLVFNNAMSYTHRFLLSIASIGNKYIRKHGGGLWKFFQLPIKNLNG